MPSLTPFFRFLNTLFLDFEIPLFVRFFTVPFLMG